MAQNINIIVAMNTKNVIGVNNQLPWHITEDLKFFKEMTLNKTIIMGRKTFDSINRPLPKRENIIITRNKSFFAPGVKVVSSLEEAYDISKGKEVFVIGGGEIFTEALNKAVRMYITIIDIDVKNPSVFFPNVDYENWNLVKENIVTSKSGVMCNFKEYIKIGVKLG